MSAPNKLLQRTVIRRHVRTANAAFIMHSRRASHDSAPPLNYGVRVEMFSRYRTSIALLAGVTAGWVANWALMNAMSLVAEGAIHGITSAPWVATFYFCAFVVSMMLPGFVAGLVAGRGGRMRGTSALQHLAGAEA